MVLDSDFFGDAPAAAQSIGGCSERAPGASRAPLHVDSIGGPSVFSPSRPPGYFIEDRTEGCDVHLLTSDRTVMGAHWIALIGGLEYFFAMSDGGRLDKRGEVISVDASDEVVEYVLDLGYGTPTFSKGLPFLKGLAQLASSWESRQLWRAVVTNLSRINFKEMIMPFEELAVMTGWACVFQDFQTARELTEEALKCRTLASQMTIQNIMDAQCMLPVGVWSAKLILCSLASSQDEKPKEVVMGFDGDDASSFYHVDLVATDGSRHKICSSFLPPTAREKIVDGMLKVDGDAETVVSLVDVCNKKGLMSMELQRFQNLYNLCSRLNFVKMCLWLSAAVGDLPTTSLVEMLPFSAEHLDSEMGNHIVEALRSRELEANEEVIHRIVTTDGGSAATRVALQILARGSSTEKLKETAKFGLATPPFYRVGQRRPFPFKDDGPFPAAP